jgi:PhnB protein
MATLNPWINFNGNAEEAFTFYKSVLGGEFAKVVRFKDLASAQFPVPEKEENKIMYIALPIGAGTMLIANDVPEVLGRVNERENRSKILVRAESKVEADRLFTGLSAGGAVEGPMGDGPYGSYMGMFRDKYGIEWIIEFSYNT